MRQCKLGDFCWVATFPRPDLAARLARFPYRINSLYGSDVYRINEVARAAQEWQEATVLKCASSFRSRKSLGFEGKAN